MYWFMKTLKTKTMKKVLWSYISYALLFVIYSYFVSEIPVIVTIITILIFLLYAGLWSKYILYDKVY
jgi:hypothetical protein